jgi:hypothetical protein
MLLSFSRLKLSEGIFKVGQSTFRFSNLSIVTPQNILIVGGLAQELGGF